MTIKFRSDMTVQVMDVMGDDYSPIQAARVSTEGADSRTTEDNNGLRRYLLREKHLVPFETQVMRFYIEAPIFVTRQILKHRMCLSGDTRVMRVYRDGRSYGNVNNTIEKLWELWHEGATRRHRSGTEFRALLPNRKDVWVRSYDEITKEPKISKVRDIVKNGVRETWEVRTKNGHTLRATKDHKFFTPDGWKTLGELSPGDTTYRQGKVAINTEPWIPPRLRQGIGLWTTSKRKDVINSRGDKCYICQGFFPFEELELDHKIPVVEDLEKSLSVSNLAPICPDCHRIKTARENGVRERMGSRQTIIPDEIVSIENPMWEETYDLVLDDPYHNFIAEGLVVHNSSISEESGRYKELEPVFYVPRTARPVKQVGKTGDYNFVHEELLVVKSRIQLRYIAGEAWTAYENMLEAGIAKEVARMVVPLNIYSSMYLTINTRSLFNFFDLRTFRGQSKPQHEIALVADQMYDLWKERFPLTAVAWEDSK